MSCARSTHATGLNEKKVATAYATTYIKPRERTAVFRFVKKKSNLVEALLYSRGRYSACVWFVAAVVA